MKLGHAPRIGATIVVAVTGVVAIAGVANAGPASDGGPASFPGKIAYMSTRDGPADIYSMDADGMSEFDITRDGATSARVDAEPAWSPDGSLVAFERQYAAPDYGVALMVIRADGTKLRTLLPPALRDGIRSSQPSWSPDGRSIAFTSNRDGNFELYAVKASGLGLTQLTFTKNSVANFQPQWSRDGRTILFARSERGPSSVPHANLYLLKLESGAVVQITGSPSPRGAGDNSPAWSPDGARIAFTSDRMGSNDIYVMRSDGSNVERLTTKRSNDNHPTWAPDNKTIVFLSDRTGATELFMLSPATPRPKQLTFDKALKSGPTWQQVTPVSSVGLHTD
jgi:Tol biopolymer transport system component